MKYVKEGECMTDKYVLLEIAYQLERIADSLGWLEPICNHLEDMK
jgi:hypothetical protein